MGGTKEDAVVDSLHVIRAFERSNRETIEGEPLKTCFLFTKSGAGRVAGSVHKSTLFVLVW